MPKNNLIKTVQNILPIGTIAKNKAELVKLLKGNIGNYIKVESDNHYIGSFTYENYTFRISAPISQVRKIVSCNNLAIKSELIYMKFKGNGEEYLKGWIDNLVNSLNKNNKEIEIWEKEKIKKAFYLQMALNQNSLLDFDRQKGSIIQTDFPPSKEITFNKRDVKIYSYTFLLNTIKEVF